MRKRALLIATVPVLAALLVATALVLHPSSASAEDLVLFHASVSETFTAALCEGGAARCVTAVGTGQATHLGEITENATIVVDIKPADQQNGCAPETRTTTLTAANGDTITMYGTGLSCPSGDANDNFVVTGGTGHYQGASGSGTEHNTHTFTGPGVGVASVTYDGNLSSVGSLNS